MIKMLVKTKTSLIGTVHMFCVCSVHIISLLLSFMPASTSLEGNEHTNSLQLAKLKRSTPNLTVHVPRVNNKSHFLSSLLCCSVQIKETRFVWVMLGKRSITVYRKFSRKTLLIQIDSVANWYQKKRKPAFVTHI